MTASLACTPLGQRLITETNGLYIKRKEQTGKWDELQKICDELAGASAESITQEDLEHRLVGQFDCVLFWFDSREEDYDYNSCVT